MRRIGARAAPERWSGDAAFRARDSNDWRQHLFQIATRRSGRIPVASAARAEPERSLTDLLRE
jgi:hypothetical protein